MSFVFKVVGNFNDTNFEKITTKISQKFLFMYLDKTFFIALKSWNEREGAIDLMSKTFRPVKDFYIEEVTEQNIIRQQSFIKEWCLKQLVRLDTERYEEENQQRLKKVWEAMDNMESQLQQELFVSSSQQ